MAFVSRYHIVGMLAELRTALSGVRVASDTIGALNRWHSEPDVSMDLYPLLEVEQSDGTVFAGLLISLWNRGNESADHGYLSFRPDGWSLLALNTPDGVDLQRTSFGYVTEFPEKPVFAEHTNRVALVGGAFNPADEYHVHFEAGCRDGGVKYGSYRMWVEEGSIQIEREEYSEPVGE